MPCELSFILPHCFFLLFVIDMFKVTIFYACFNFLSNFNISLRVVAIGILRHFSFRSFLFICFEMELTVKTCFL